MNSCRFPLHDEASSEKREPASALDSLMPLPINIHQLLNGQVVEWERLEFKEGWNPEAVLHTLCAFANDFNNWGGGYLVIGVAEHSGRPVLPPVGLEPNQLDPIQRKMIELGHKLRPAYHPIMVPALVDGRHVLVVWAPGGDLRRSIECPWEL